MNPINPINTINTKKDRTNKCLYKLKNAFETPPFSFILSGNILATLKPALFDSGFNDFPVFALIGGKGSGKTSVARACIKGTPEEYYFVDSVSKVKKELLESQAKYILLDDLANFNSYAAKQKGAKFLDEIVRTSYGSKYSISMPLIVITVEDKVMPYITASCRDRMLEIQADGLIDDDKLRSILDDLNTYGANLNEIFNEFDKWYKTKEYDFSNLLYGFREKKPPFMDFRSCSIYFAYFISMALLNTFLAEKYNDGINIQTIHNNFLDLYKIKRLAMMDETETIKYVFNSLLEKRAIEYVKPEAYYLCEGYCSGYSDTCYKYMRYGCSTNNEAYCEISEKTGVQKYAMHYDPKYLIINQRLQNAIFIADPTYIMDYPVYNIKQPLLIIQNSLLLEKINNELALLHDDLGLAIEPFGPKSLHKALFEANMLMYKIIDKNHKVYTYDYSLDDNKKINVCVLRLDDEQCKLLKKHTPIPNVMMADNPNIKFIKKLKQLIGNMHYMYNVSKCV